MLLLFWFIYTKTTNDIYLKDMRRDSVDSWMLWNIEPKNIKENCESHCMVNTNNKFERYTTGEDMIEE